MFAFGGIEPDAVSYSLLAGYGNAHGKYILDVDPGYGQVQSSALPLLINDAGRLVYGGATVEYALNAYTKTYGGAVIEYILGGIEDAEFASTVTITAPFTAEAEVDALFASTVTLTTAFTAEVIVDAEFSSTIQITDLFTPGAEMEALFASLIEIASDLFPDQQEIDVWAFTLGGEAAPASRYENFEFNSFALVEGYYYAFGDDGIFELGGEDDQGVGIAAHILTGSRPQGVDRLQRMPILYLTGRSEGVLRCAVVDEEGTAHDYTAERRLGARESRQRVKLGRGLKASLWQLRISNEAGQDFELENAGSLPDVLKRRVG